MTRDEGKGMTRRSALKWMAVGAGAASLAWLITFYVIYRVTLLGPLNPPVANPIYSRSDCLVRVDIAYPEGTDGEDWLVFRREVSYAFVGVSLPKKYPVFDWDLTDKERILILFTQRCDKKFAMAKTMTDAYNAEHPKGARLSVSRDRIAPGALGAETSGSWWTDQH